MRFRVRQIDCDWGPSDLGHPRRSGLCRFQPATKPTTLALRDIRCLDVQANLYPFYKHTFRAIRDGPLMWALKSSCVAR